jgi:hypothetical protein
MAIVEAIHLRKSFTRGIACGITGSVRITERLSEATCQRCYYEGDPVARTRALMVEAAHAEALEMHTEITGEVPVRRTTAERNRQAYIDAIDAQIAELLARRAALVGPPFRVGDLVHRTDDEGFDRWQVWVVTRVDAVDPRKVSLGQRGDDWRMAMNVSAATLVEAQV